MRRSKNRGASIYKALIGCLLLLAPQPGVRGQQQGPDIDQDKNVIRQRTSVVVVNVSVTDKQFRQISGLNKDHFEIYEDKVRQQIDFFSDEDRPASVGIIFDLSGSMNNKMSKLSLTPAMIKTISSWSDSTSALRCWSSFRTGGASSTNLRWPSLAARRPSMTPPIWASKKSKRAATTSGRS
jgi:hypothetical protein